MAHEHDSWLDGLDDSWLPRRDTAAAFFAELTRRLSFARSFSEGEGGCDDLHAEHVRELLKFMMRNERLWVEGEHQVPSVAAAIVHNLHRLSRLLRHHPLDRAKYAREILALSYLRQDLLDCRSTQVGVS